MAKEILIGSLGLGLVFLGVFLFYSLDSLDYNHVGLNYSYYFKSVENKTYTSGYHFIGLGHDFISYDLTVQNMEFSNNKDATLPPINCRTKDGLSLNLEISFQYRVLKNNIYDIYTTFGNELTNILLRVAIDAISDASTSYRAYDFFTIRSQISEAMGQVLNSRLQQALNTEIVFFQLRSIDLPDNYELAIQQTEVTKQSILKADAQRLKNQVLQNTRIQVANISQGITINQAQAQAQTKKLKVDSTSGTFLNITQSQAQAFADLKTNLSFSNQDLINYLQISLVQNYPTGNLVINLKDQTATQ